MQYRNFCGVDISEVGLGTWQLGSADWGDVDEAEALDILRRSVELGVNFLDTADVYGMGHSERMLGRFLNESNEDVRVATKLGRRHDDPNGWPQNFTEESMRQHTENSLRNMKLETVFLTQLHCIPAEELQRGEVFENLRGQQSAGLIEHWGVSVETVEEGMLCLEQEGLASLQVIFNVFRQNPARELLPKAREKGVAIIARVPLASGLLSGKFSAEDKFAESDHRHYNANGECFNVGETFAGVEFLRGVKLAEDVRILLPQEAPMAQEALRWVLDHEAITTVIPGATKLLQAEGNTTASTLPALGQDIHEALKELYDTEIEKVIRGSY